MLEVCIDNLESAINAIHGGADELEVCSSLPEGGLTPSPGLVYNILKMVDNIAHKKVIYKSCVQCSCPNFSKIPKVNIMIRCRTGSDFCYTTEEVDTMLSDINYYKSLKINRFVFGALTPNQTIDKEICSKIINMAHPVPVTFHRAFDLCENPFATMEDIIQLGFNRLLTSGQQPSADHANAIELLKKLISAYSSQIEIMPGAGINVDNVKKFMDIGCKNIHSSCKKSREVPYIKNNLSMGTNCTEYIYCTDENIVKQLKTHIS